MQQNIYKSRELRASQLYRRLDPSELPFRTTSDLTPIAGVPGQERALESLRLALGSELSSFNVFVSGIPGSGRGVLAQEVANEYTSRQTTPPDIVVLFNFKDPDQPSTVALPPGTGKNLQRSLDEFIRTALREIPSAFESETYEKRRHEFLDTLHRRRKELFEDAQSFAREREVTIEATPTGFVSMPLINGKPIDTRDFEKLSPGAKRAIEARSQEVQRKIRAVLRELTHLAHEEEEVVRRLDRDTARFALGSLIEDLRENFRAYSSLHRYFQDLEKDILDHLSEFRSHDGEENELSRLLFSGESPLNRQARLNRYRANLLVDHSETSGAPVIYEHNPSYYNLFGRIDYRPSIGAMGAMTTDLLEIKAGSLLRANGGVLIIDALELLQAPLSWQSLKRALRSGELRIENLGDQITLIPIATLKPSPIPLKVRVILIGSPWVYQLLFKMDEEFKDLFVLKADFAPELDWNEANIRDCSGFIAHCVKTHSLLPFDRSGVARLIEYSARIQENQTKLTARLKEIENLCVEAHAIASQKTSADRSKLITGADVEAAIENKVYRSNLTETRLQEWIARGTLMIDTEGSKVGQVNGIAVHDFGDYAFGRPTRITASVALGRGTIRSIERESKLSGKIHSKGFLILSGYLQAKYAHELPLALAATITFEQSYDEVEGDSASSTELYALLSSLSGVPIQQGVAVTGSCNQQGEIQAVGAINDKIEGYFAVCEKLGLNGKQGVLIPASNVIHLMLKKKVRDAVERGSFHIWAVKTLDEGIEILTGVPAGTFQAGLGDYPSGSIHFLAQNRLRDYANKLRSFMNKEGKGEVSGLKKVG
jgi:lon-related putative ATP-dependent protease